MTLKLGVHVSISGGISHSVDNALEIGCSAFQIFTRSPRQWKTKELTPHETDIFKEKLDNSPINPKSVVVHMPYLPNLSAPTSEMYEKSILVLTDEVTRCNMLGVPYLIIHLGSHLGQGPKNGINQLVNACRKSLDAYSDLGLPRNKVKILLENSAGQKNSIGSRIEEIQSIFHILGQNDFGLCLDTCHLFAAGYDLSTGSNVSTLIDLVDSSIGLENLKIIHLNDSKGDLGSNLDRHYHVGLGKIGEGGLKSLINNKKLSQVPFIMETPIDSIRNDADNLEFVRNVLTDSH
ncbi:deoxyribonuclease IV [Candidatus Nitrosocosmicus arcticus]|uniref:Probable endonuclease 4 n=1 Tax=Candidatus Nitrosocosmicus arcticus TaxID=2035267 RepID=A0A557SSI1_9ARCH|nr:deoxyribonuclease IV [Candidatus Nitrosocosmicus arcticus]TVP39548.1 putative endonuclease IV/apurinic/apyrimidinic lyase [Candidatus Nitrosocosmicus arcticus]